MRIIDDKEVGKIFRYWIKQRESARQRPSYSNDFYEANQVCDLIRKLVAESAKHTFVYYPIGHQGPKPNAVQCTLERYGIDPTDWKDDD